MDREDTIKQLAEVNSEIALERKGIKITTVGKEKEVSFYVHNYVDADEISRIISKWLLKKRGMYMSRLILEQNKLEGLLFKDLEADYGG